MILPPKAPGNRTLHDPVPEGHILNVGLSVQVHPDEAGLSASATRVTSVSYTTTYGARFSRSQ